MESAQPIELPGDYYLSNFHALAGFVYKTYLDILKTAELNWYTSFQRCDEPAQRLYVRLLTRKASVFRLSRLRYPEIVSLQSAAKRLAEAELGDVAPPKSLQALMSAYTKPELLILLELGALKSKSRVDLIEAIMCSKESDQEQYRHILQTADQWITVKGHSYWNLYNLCFFGNLYQDSSEFVLRDLGSVTYESYDIAPNCRVFKSRSQIDSHMKYFECTALLDTINRTSIEQHKDILQELPDGIPGDSQLNRRLDRLRNRIARQLERLGDSSAALALFKQSQRPPARERSVRILLGDGQLDQASLIINDMMANPVGESESQVALRLHKLWAKNSGNPLKPEKRFRPETTTLTLTQTEQRVEFSTRKFYSTKGVCFYTENQLVNAVLGLFIWDIIFYPTAGVFYNPFQYAPSDFYDPEFKKSRGSLITKRFSDLDEPQRFYARVVENFAIHSGKANPLVRWSGISIELLTIALDRIPVTHWRVMFNRILNDPRENMAGFPDLILFRDDDLHYEFIEVKGPGDTIQQNQLRWMQYFSEFEIPCRVVNVRWAETVSSIDSV